MESLKIKKRAVYLSLIVGVAMFSSKAFAYFLTNSTAIYSDAAESIINILASSMAIFSIYLSAKPADKDHLYGHGNIEFFSAGMEGLFIILASIAIMYSAINDIITGANPEQLNVGTFIIGMAGVVNLVVGFYLVKQGKRYNSLTLIADGKHLLTDSVTSFGVVIGLIIVLITNIYELDPIIAIFVALNILFTGYKLIRESIGGLMIETDPLLLDKISNIIIKIRKPHWIDVHQLRFWKSSNNVFVDFHMILPYYFTIQHVHDDDDFISSELKKELPNSQIKIHYDYCEPNFCKYCEYINCTERKEDFKSKVDWTPKRFLTDLDLHDSVEL